MYISPTEYLELADRVDLLRAEYSTAHKENENLKKVVARQQETIKILESKL